MTNFAKTLQQLPEVISMTNEQQLVTILRRVEEKIDKVLYSLEENQHKEKQPKERKINSPGEVRDAILKLLSDGEPRHCFEITKQLNDKKMTSCAVVEKSVYKEARALWEEDKIFRIRESVYISKEVSHD